MKAKQILLLGSFLTVLCPLSCSRDIPNTQSPSNRIYPVCLYLESPPPIMTPGTTRWCVERLNKGNPRQLNISWDEKENMRINLYLFQQEHNEDWRKDPRKYLEVTAIIPPGSNAIVKNNGKKILDLSKVKEFNVDFTGKDFDPNKKLKYVLVAGSQDFGFGVVPSLVQAPLSGNNGQIGHMKAWTKVLETQHPEKTGGTLVLKGNLEWATSVLAVKFEVASQFADKTFNTPGSGLSFRLTKGKRNFPKYIDPVLRKPRLKYNNPQKDFRTFYAFGVSLYGETPKISQMVDEMGYRYFPIPAEVEGTGIDLTGAELQWSDALSYPKLTYGGKEFKNGEVIGRLKEGVHIVPGKCYGIIIEVKDTGDGTPTFVKK